MDATTSETSTEVSPIVQGMDATGNWQTPQEVAIVNLGACSPKFGSWDTNREGIASEDVYYFTLGPGVILEANAEQVRSFMEEMQQELLKGLKLSFDQREPIIRLNAARDSLGSLGR